MPGHAHRVVLDGRVALHRRVDRDDDLIRRGPLKIVELLIESCHRRPADDPGIIVEMGRRGGGYLLCRSQARGKTCQCRQAKKGAQPTRAPADRRHGFAGAGLLKSNCTLGGVSLPGVAVK